MQHRYGAAARMCSQVLVDLNALDVSVLDIDLPETIEPSQADALVTSLQSAHTKPPSSTRSLRSRRRISYRRVANRGSRSRPKGGARRARVDNETRKEEAQEFVFRQDARAGAFAVLVRTNKGVTGNIPILNQTESGDSRTAMYDFVHVSPCKEGEETELGQSDNATVCHTFTYVSTYEMSTIDATGGDDAVRNVQDVDIPISGANRNATDKQNATEDVRGDEWWDNGDPFCGNGTPSQSYRACCPTDVCGSECMDEGVPITSGGYPHDCYTEHIYTLGRTCDQHAAPCDMRVVQTVTVAYTTEAKNANSDIMGLIHLAIAEANLAYLQSAVPIFLELMVAYETTLEDGYDSHDLLQVFRFEDKRGASMSILLTELVSDVCGRAYLDVLQHSQALARSVACGIVRTSCATGYYTFAHELGHIQGLDHNLAPPSVITGRFIDSFAFYDSDAGVRTIMGIALSGELDTTQRILYFSNPDIIVDGVHIGVHDESNNARVLRFTRYGIADLAVEPTESPTDTPALPPSALIVHGTPAPSSNNNTTCVPTPYKLRRQMLTP